MALLGSGALLVAQNPAPASAIAGTHPAHATYKSHKANKILTSASSPSTPLQAAAPTPPPEPPKPDWPANDKPAPAKIIWDTHGLAIEANNSSLEQILHEVATDTGAKLDGKVGEERIFGSYGPGSARDVIAQLLDGTAYNVLMVGDQGQGTPREIVLTNRPTGPAPANNAQNNNEEAGEYEQPQQPMPGIPPMRNGFGPQGMPPEQYQQMEERRAELEQQRQEQLQQQQQQQQTPPQ
ncbi:MAG TPA: hypothetical protein VME23_07205 [Terracidiphilus sp.]|nr:hypothetical protein [Terracidiphilus sp.]